MQTFYHFSEVDEGFRFSAYGAGVRPGVCGVGWTCASVAFMLRNAFGVRVRVRDGEGGGCQPLCCVSSRGFGKQSINRAQDSNSG